MARMNPRLCEDVIQGIWACMQHDQRAVRKAALTALPAIVEPGHPAMVEGILRGLTDDYSETKKLAVSLIGYVCMYLYLYMYTYVYMYMCVYVCMYQAIPPWLRAYYVA